ncbi:MAG: hypothetical protein H6831_10465 [Planctomycetes bacterium]|nr:hypothetical protein [Planctomycetota bacterium]
METCRGREASIFEMLNWIHGLGGVLLVLWAMESCVFLLSYKLFSRS